MTEEITDAADACGVGARNPGDSGALGRPEPAPVVVKLADPPDGFGTQLLFKHLPPYMQDILRRMWARLTDIERDNVLNNLEGWARSHHPPEYKGGILVGEGAAITNEESQPKPFKAGKTYGSKTARL